MAPLPFDLPSPLAGRLGAALDIERKLPRALETLGPLVNRKVVFVGMPHGPLVAGLRELGVRARRRTDKGPLRLKVPDGSIDAVVASWSAFRGVNQAELAEVDRALRPGGRLLVVHDYGRDDVKFLRPADSPEYTSWGRREGPFLRGGFKIRVIHCFWTFESLDDARSLLSDAFGEAGRELGERLRRPRVAWNVAIYHRDRGAGPADPAAKPPATGGG
jgi:SAM-dependent methyltransferase